MKAFTLTRGHLVAVVAIAIALGSMAVLSWAFADKLELSRQLRLEEARLELDLAAEEARFQGLLADRERVRTDEYVEEWARREMRMRKPGEVLVVPRRATAQEVATPASPVQVPEAERKPIWREIWELLIGPAGRP